MPDLELRQKIEQQLAQLPPDQLPLVSEFLDSLQNKGSMSRPLRRLPPLNEAGKQQILGNNLNPKN
ncbi:hypothetical protein [Egbenema bharatensis]|uniref:hypothetical protein n=1 Tax=Egbenema bharatensis TaxID=3463334 RepID=UPI003A867789